MAYVNQDSTSAVVAGGVINIGKPFHVSGGSNVPIIRAHQIGWGTSYFNNVEFGSTEGLLSEIENAISNAAAGGEILAASMWETYVPATDEPAEGEETPDAGE
jgi:hypothetical protein